MQKANREHIREHLERTGIIPVLRASSAKEAVALVEALAAGGIDVVEVTMTVPGAVEVLRELKRSYGEKLLLGSGTVTDAKQCAATIEAGAEFVVSPSLHPEVIAVTREHGKVSIPGALTPTEAITAWNAGADIVKIFPCSAVGGASYLKALKAPFPQLRLVPTGGVNLQTGTSYLEAGACALGVGGDLVNAAAIAAGKPEVVTSAARAYLDLIAAFRAKSAGGDKKPS